MVQKTVRLELHSSDKTSGTNNVATFWNIPWETLIPRGTKKIRVRADFVTAQDNYRDITAGTSLKNVCIVKATFNNTTSLDAVGARENTLLRATRNEASSTQAPSGKTNYIFQDNGETQVELTNCPQGALTIQLYMYTDAGAETALLKSTLSGSDYVNDTDAGAWYLTLKLLCDIEEPTTNSPNPYAL